MSRTEPISRVRATWVTAAVLTAAAGLLAACSSPASTSGTTGTPKTTASASASGAAVAASFVNIIEPFDPGHPAQLRTAPASCKQATTIAIEQCYEIKTENLDVAIDKAQLAKYTSATSAGKTAILAQDSAWLAARQPVCAAAFNTGGTIDGISAAICMMQESAARLYAVQGQTAPQMKLQGTDSQDPNQLAWYTTPEGSRIAEMNSQGDETGGAIVGWIVIGGADGFVINPKQFYFQDKSFTDAGIVESPNPTYHRVATGKEYQFAIDYSTLSKDPNTNKSASAYVYAPGSPVALWQ